MGDFIFKSSLLQEHQVEELSKSHEILDEATYDFLTFYKADTSKLIPVKKIVHRQGKLYTKTVYINPDKDVKGLSYSKKYVNDSVAPKLQKVGTTRLTSTQYTKGDKVKFTMQDGTEGTGEFRHIAVNKKHIDGEYAIIRAKNKT
jgi:hypothetical protein